MQIIKTSDAHGEAQEEINFKKLRELFFGHKSHQEILEKFIYERLPEEFMNSYRQLLNQGKSIECLIYDVPLLFEKKLDSKVDLKVCVYTTPATQRQRLISRDKISAELANEIISHQISIDEKAKLSDVVIDNNGDLISLEANVEKFLADYF